MMMGWSLHESLGRWTERSMVVVAYHCVQATGVQHRAWVSATLVTYNILF